VVEETVAFHGIPADGAIADLQCAVVVDAAAGAECTIPGDSAPVNCQRAATVDAAAAAENHRIPADGAIVNRQLAFVVDAATTRIPTIGSVADSEI